MLKFKNPFSSHKIKKPTNKKQKTKTNQNTTKTKLNMQFTSNIIVALLLVGSSSTISAAQKTSSNLRGDGRGLGGAETAMCNAANDGCTLTDGTITTLSPRQLAQIWNEATDGMTGARTDGGATSCESAVAIALMECAYIGPLTAAIYNGIDTPICSIPNSKAFGVWQVTSSDSDDVAGSGCSDYKSECDAGDPCCNARLAYAHANLKVTASVFDTGTCTIDGNTVTTIPDCSSVQTKNMPCYDGPFGLNAELDRANAPYAPPTTAIDACFPGILSCNRPAHEWGGWGAPYDLYHNSFCCLTAQCGASDPGNVNWDCFNRGASDKAYACAATNPQNKAGSSGVTGQSTATTGELATEACAALN